MLHLNGPISSCLQIVQEQLELLKTTEKLEQKGLPNSPKVVR